MDTSTNHPIVRDYIAFIEKQRRGSVWQRAGLALAILFAVAFCILAVVVLNHERTEGKSYGGVSGPFIAVAVFGGLYLRRQDRFKKQLTLARHAVPVWAQLIQANSRLFKRGDPNAVLPCLVVFSFEIDGGSQFMEEIARRIFGLRSQLQLDPDLAYVRSLSADERPVHYRVRQLPPSFTGTDVPIYVADLHVLRSQLKQGKLTTSSLLCLAGTETPGLELVPWQVQEGAV
ncbi:MAG TPA: hypothetical protein VKT77_13730 [Chthonomonadaceae bacterium]|nr:hypothetical protein [Chthonomonadaceae bacterium]